MGTRCCATARKEEGLSPRFPSVDQLWRRCGLRSHTEDDCGGPGADEGVMDDLERDGIGRGVDWGGVNSNFFTGSAKGDQLTIVRHPRGPSCKRQQVAALS